MKEIINWIINIEDRAARCYEKAATIFSEEKELADLLARMAEEERFHRELAVEAAESIKDKKHIPFFIYLDEDSKQKIEHPFLEFEKHLARGGLTKEALFECMVAAEFSEWNDLFLYIINTVKGSHDFSRVAPKIQQHKRCIERFLESDPALKGHCERIKGLHPVWREKILIVDDSDIIAALFSTVLREEGAVESAANGVEALEKLERDYFAAIITDVDMPVMNGIEFYKKAVERYPNIKERVLFCTGSDITEYLSFFKENNLTYIIRPVPIKELKNAVVDILKR
jgi:CheY-like chemotaxis protein